MVGGAQCKMFFVTFGLFNCIDVPLKLSRLKILELLCDKNPASNFFKNWIHNFYAAPTLILKGSPISFLPYTLKNHVKKAVPKNSPPGAHAPTIPLPDEVHHPLWHYPRTRQAPKEVAPHSFWKITMNKMWLLESLSPLQRMHQFGDSSIYGLFWIMSKVFIRFIAAVQINALTLGGTWGFKSYGEEIVRDITKWNLKPWRRT